MGERTCFELTDGVTYGYTRHDPPVLRGLHCSFPAGSTTAVVGASGVGKSTLLNLLGLLWDEPLQQGEIVYHDEKGTPQHYNRLSSRQRANLRRTEFGFVPQSCFLLPHLTCEQNLRLPLVLQGLSPRQARDQAQQFLNAVEQLLDKETFDKLLGVQQHYGGEVSGGERQRFAVLRAIIHNPQVVFADEPVSNLDAKTSSDFRTLLRKWLGNEVPLLPPRGPRTLVLVCHDEAIATDLADQILLLRPGKDGASGELIPNGPPRLSTATLRELIQGKPQTN